ncbi:P-II family nitrogen regulator [Enterococcus faecium]|nr:P-II family nitrogen regulator [Enterococcus faecium]
MKDLVALNLHMIVTIVDGGTGEDVIDFSKEAGAAGGTILRGRGSGVHDSGKFLGLDISPEKDVVLTLVPDSLTNQVMDAIGQGINIDVPGNGICFSIDVDKVIGITKIHQYREIIGMQELLDETNDRESPES